MMFFALEHAPDDVITEWATEHDVDLVNEAVERVGYIRKNMPNLTRLWQGKSTSVVPPMISMDYDVVHNSEGETTGACVYISAGRIAAIGRPDLTDANRIRFRLWPSDVEYLILQLERLRHTYFVEAGQEGAKEDGSRDDTAEGASAEG
jgi:hypothetical protein